MDVVSKYFVDNAVSIPDVFSKNFSAFIKLDCRGVISPIINFFGVDMILAEKIFE